jgi:hypothetical protein
VKGNFFILFLNFFYSQRSRQFSRFYAPFYEIFEVITRKTLVVVFLRRSDSDEA